jgi:serine/threonine protein kinase
VPQGQSVDRRSDVFSLGIVLYELTVGRRLFTGASDLEVLKRIVEMPVVPPRALVPDYDPQLEAIVMRALASRREDRYQTARELQIDLEAMARERRLSTSPLVLESYMRQLFGDRRDEVCVETVAAPSLYAETSAEPDVPRRRRRVWPATVASIGAAALAIGAWVAHRSGGHTARASTVMASALPSAPDRQPRWTPLYMPPPSTPPPSIAADEPVAKPPVRHRVRGRARSADVALSVEGTLVFATHPWCTVSVDGVVRGPTPMRLALPAGTHTIRLQNPEFAVDHTMTMEIPANETIRRRIDFPTGGN